MGGVIERVRVAPQALLAAVASIELSVRTGIKYAQGIDELVGAPALLTVGTTTFPATPIIVLALNWTLILLVLYLTIPTVYPSVLKTWIRDGHNRYAATVGAFALAVLGPILVMDGLAPVPVLALIAFGPLLVAAYVRHSRQESLVEPSGIGGQWWEWLHSRVHPHGASYFRLSVSRLRDRGGISWYVFYCFSAYGLGLFLCYHSCY